MTANSLRFEIIELSSSLGHWVSFIEETSVFAHLDSPENEVSMIIKLLFLCSCKDLPLLTQFQIIQILLLLGIEGETGFLKDLLFIVGLYGDSSLTSCILNSILSTLTSSFPASLPSSSTSP